MHGASQTEQVLEAKKTRDKRGFSTSKMSVYFVEMLTWVVGANR